MIEPTARLSPFLTSVMWKANTLATQNSCGYRYERMLLHQGPDAWLQYRQETLQRPPDLVEVQMAQVLSQAVQSHPVWDDLGTRRDLWQLADSVLAQLQAQANAQGIGQAVSYLPKLNLKPAEWEPSFQAPIKTAPECPGKWDRDHWHPEIA